jgi:hypothetical protein
MFQRTYSPLPAWPVLGAATVLFLAPGYRPRLCAAVMIAGHVAGPLLARLLMAIDNNLFEFPTTEEPSPNAAPH